MNLEQELKETKEYLKEVQEKPFDFEDSLIIGFREEYTEEEYAKLCDNAKTELIQDLEEEIELLEQQINDLIEYIALELKNDRETEHLKKELYELMKEVNNEKKRSN